MKKAMNKTMWMCWMTGVALMLAVPLYAKPGNRDNRGPDNRNDRPPRLETQRAPQPDRGGRGFDRCPTPRREPDHRQNGWGMFLNAVADVLTPPPPRGYWQEREERVWVDGCWVEVVDAYGRPARAWQPGYWQTRMNRVWIP